MPTEITAKLSSSDALTITLADLPSSTSGVGRQSTVIDNSANLFQIIHVYAKVTTGSSPTDNKSIKLHSIKGDKHSSDPYRTDGAGSADAGITIVNSPLLAAAATDDTSDKAYYLEGDILNPGPQWGVSVVHDTGVSLNASAGLHFVHWVGENPEIQD